MVASVVADGEKAEGTYKCYSCTTDINNGNGCHDGDSLESNSQVAQKNCPKGCQTVTATGRDENDNKVDDIERRCYEGDDTNEDQYGCLSVDLNVSTAFSKYLSAVKSAIFVSYVFAANQ